MCSSLQAVHRLARAQSQNLIAQRNTTGYDGHGLFGIFGNGDAIAGKPGRRYFTDYGGVKVAFLHREACAMPGVAVACEIGFCAGLSALLLLEAFPRARVLSFDLGNLPWAHAADDMLRAQYAPARFPGVVFGDAAATIPRERRAASFCVRCGLCRRRQVVRRSVRLAGKAPRGLARRRRRLHGRGHEPKRASTVRTRLSSTSATVATEMPTTGRRFALTTAPRAKGGCGSSGAPGRRDIGTTGSAWPGSTLDCASLLGGANFDGNSVHFHG